MMEYTYQLTEGNTIKRSDGAWIPISETNGHYRQYLKWLEDGNTPLPADVPVVDYKTQRAAAYDSVQDQLDLLWHAMDDGDLPKHIEFYNRIKAVKDKYPKSGSI